MCGHALTFALFWAMTRIMFESDDAPSGPALLWLSAWAARCGQRVHALRGVDRRAARFGPVGRLGACGAGLSLAWVMNEFGAWTQNLWRPFSAAALAMAAFLLRLGFPQVEGRRGELRARARRLCRARGGGKQRPRGMGMGLLLTRFIWAIFRRELRFPRAFSLLALGLTLQLGSATDCGWHW